MVRSQHDSLSGDLETERHIVPPKISQAMAELHSKFDLAGGMRKDAAGYDLASREAGSAEQGDGKGSGDAGRPEHDGVLSPRGWGC